jgi:hypothetical protein
MRRVYKTTICAGLSIKCAMVVGSEEQEA